MVLADTDDCSSMPCRYGMCTDRVNGYTCVCYDGYNGTDCENNVDDCASDPCVFGNCTDLINAFNCTCDDGYEGETCDTGKY